MQKGTRVIDVSTERLARERSADALIDPRTVDPVQAIKKLTHGAGAENRPLEMSRCKWRLTNSAGQ